MEVFVGREGPTLARQLDKVAERIETAITRSVAAAGAFTKNKLREDIRGAGLGGRVANAWQNQVYPRSGTSANAATLVYTKAPNIVTAFSEGLVIRARNKKFLAVPTSNAPKSIQGKRTSPALMEQAGYDLELFVFRGGSIMALVAIATPATRRTDARRRARGAGRLQRARFKVMFWLVPDVRMPKLLGTPQERGEEGQNELARLLYLQLDQLGVEVL